MQFAELCFLSRFVRFVASAHLTLHIHLPTFGVPHCKKQQLPQGRCCKDNL
jgi:hypothetical protein